MPVLKLHNITKTYPIDKATFCYALNKIDLQFDSCGLVIITGKSGSGKSTILNIASGIEKPTTGVVEIFNKNINQDSAYLSYLEANYLSFLHQDYLLIEEEDVLYNLTLPLLINGEDSKSANKKAKALILKFGFLEEFLYQKVSSLSGGEKQRVALLRCIIKGPKILFMDEPTSSLDSKNKIEVMDIIKRISSKTLVLLVTHDTYIANKYADIFINMEDGEIIDKKIINQNRDLHVVIDPKHKLKQNTFINYQIKKRLKANLKKKFLITIGEIFSFIIMLIVFGFNTSAPNIMAKECNNILDIGVFQLSKEEYRKETDSPISLIKTSRPNDRETNMYLLDKDYFTVMNNYSYLLSNITSIKLFNENISPPLLSPIYRFDKDYIDSKLLSMGRLPIKENEILINTLLFKQLSSNTNREILNEYIDISFQKSTRINILEEEYISDTFVLEKSLKIVGVVEEVNIINYPKIYYSYFDLDNTLSLMYLNNLSSYLNRNYSWKERIADASNSEEITSYSKYLFLSDLNKLSMAEENMKDNKSLSLSNVSISIKNTALEIIEIIKIGLDIFLILIMIGVIILLILTSLCSYLEEKRNVAIYQTLGVKKTSIENIYLSENILFTISSLLIGIVLSYPITILINVIIEHYLKIKSIISIPLFTFCNIPILLPAIVLLMGIGLSILATSIPMVISRKHSLKEEIKNND